MMIKLVTPDFKAPKKKRESLLIEEIHELKNEIEELKERLEEQTKRADEFYDEIESMRDEKDSLECNFEDIKSMIDNVRLTKERAHLGIAGQFEELEQLIEKVLEANL